MIQNAEISLGAIRDLRGVRAWLTGTFLYVRLRANPSHYELDGGEEINDLDSRIERICNRDIELLREAGMISVVDCLRCTEFGMAMARDCINVGNCEQSNAYHRGHTDETF